MHGGFHDGRSWADTVEALRDSGHDAIAPTLAGHGPSVSRLVTHEDQVRSVLNAVDDAGMHDFVLVGHSYGGCVIQRVAEEIADRVGHLVFLQARVVLPGTSSAASLPAGFVTQADIDRGEMPVPNFHDFVVAFMSPDVDERVARRAYATLNPNPAGPVVEVLALERFFQLEIPTTVIWSAEDASMPEGYRSYPDQSSRLRNARIVQIPGGHEPMFTEPVGLANMLASVVGQARSSNA